MDVWLDEGLMVELVPARPRQGGGSAARVWRPQLNAVTSGQEDVMRRPSASARRCGRALLAFVLAAACDGVDEEDPDALPTALDAERNVVEGSPVDFAPNNGGVGIGTYEAGKADLFFAGIVWTGGTVRIDEGSEERGSTVAGTIEATSDEGDRFAMQFSTLFHGCSRFDSGRRRGDAARACRGG